MEHFVDEVAVCAVCMYGATYKLKFEQVTCQMLH
jgi:hypothetical protein